MVIATMYFRAVQSLGLVPDMLRSDRGNEIGVMAAAHCTLRQNPDAHRYRTTVYFPRRVWIYQLWNTPLLAKLGHLKQQIDTEREVELITFDLEDNAVMSYCMYIVRQLNLTYPPINWTDAKDLFYERVL